jgi:hypothetical protein
MNQEERLLELETSVASLTSRRRHGWRSRWAAIGAAVAVTLGGGTAIKYAGAAPGDVVQNSFVPLSPTRILDTRPAPSNVGGFLGPLTAGQTHTFQVTGVAGVPANATAVVMNITVTGTNDAGYLTVYPAGAALPTASNLNWASGVTIPNLVTVKIGAAGKVSVFNFTGNAHVIADVAGYYVPGNDKFLAVDITGSPEGTATFGDGFGANAGLAFIDVTRQKTSFHVVLPPDYTAGTAIAGTFTWHTSAVSCGVDWEPNYVSVSRSGQVHILGPGASSGMTGPGVSTASATANLVQTAAFSLTSPVAATPLQPGDSYTFGLFRSADSGADTCTSSAIIDSMVLRYE